MALTFQPFVSHRRARGARHAALSARAGTVLALAVFAAGSMVWLEFGDRSDGHRAVRAELSQAARPIPEAAVGDPATRTPDALREANDTDLASPDPVTFGG